MAAQKPKQRHRRRRPLLGPPHAGTTPQKNSALLLLSCPLRAPFSSLVARPPHRPCAARGRHTRGGVSPGPRPAPTPRRGVGPPENSQGHAAVTQPGFGTRKPREPDVSRARWGGSDGQAGHATHGRHNHRRPPSTLLPPFFAHGDTEGKRTPQHARREANWKGNHPGPNTGHHRRPPLEWGAHSRAGPPGALSDATRMASSIRKGKRVRSGSPPTEHDSWDSIDSQSTAATSLRVTFRPASLAVPRCCCCCCRCTRRWARRTAFAPPPPPPPRAPRGKSNGPSLTCGRLAC